MLAMSCALTVRRSETRLNMSRLTSSTSIPSTSARAAATRSMRAPSTTPGRIALTRSILLLESFLQDILSSNKVGTHHEI